MLSSSSTFSSSETSSTPSLFATGETTVGFAGLFPLKTKPNSFESPNFVTSGSLGFNEGAAAAFCEPNEKLNDEVPKALVELALAVLAVLKAFGTDAAGPCVAALKLPKLNFGAPAEAMKIQGSTIKY